MKATDAFSNLRELDDCYIIIPGGTSFDFGNTEISIANPNGNYIVKINNLPEISDTKSASYSDETVIGRSFPIKTYSQSDNRSISIQLHYFVTQQKDVSKNLNDLHAIQSALYPREGDAGTPFVPPPVCKIKCGRLLSENEICVILKSYSVKFPTDVAWTEFGNSYLPIKYDVDTTWEVVYSSAELPGQSRIFELGS